MKHARFHDVNAKHYAVLPAKMQRSTIEGLLIDTHSALGLSPGALMTCLTMMRHTHPGAWTDPTQEPLCFAQQQTIADELGITARAVRRHEHQLASLGLVDRRLANDGSRNSRANQGMCFTPLIERAEHLCALRELAQRDVADAGILRRQCSGLRKTLRDKIATIQEVDPANTEAIAIAYSYAAFPQRLVVFTTNSALEQHRAELSDLVDRCAEILAIYDIESGMSDQIVPRHTEDTTEENIEICNRATDFERPICKQIEDNLSDAAKAAKEGLETKPASAIAVVNNKGVGHFQPSALALVADEDYRLYLDVYRGTRSTYTWDDFYQTSLALLRDLGINPSAWDEAENILGGRDAAVAVFVIACNRHHPKTPIANPGGYLRGMIAKAMLGQLNLPGSLIRLLNQGEHA